MQSQNRKFIIYQLFVQVIITIFYSFFFVNILIEAGRDGGFNGLLAPAMKYFPFLVVLICSILPEASLLIKHKLHSQDGEILPLLFMIVDLQSSLIVSDAVSALGFYFDFPFYLLILQRFSLLGTAAMFLLSSLRYFGFSSSHIGLYNFAFLAISFLVSAIIPISSYRGEMTITSSIYEVYLQIAILVIYLATIATFIIVAIKDKTALNIKRSSAFILLCLGIYLSWANFPATCIISPVVYIIGTGILVVDAGDSF